MSLVFFGRPGSGKSSLAERLVREREFTLVQTGFLLRDTARAGGVVGEHIDALLKRGEYVPDDLTLDCLEAFLSRCPRRPLLFDGFPRTVGQIPRLSDLEARYGFKVVAYLEIDVSVDEAVARMSGRRVCPRCAAVYHLRHRPPRVEGYCDHDGTPLEQRRDDSIDVIRQRQQVYDAQTGPVLACYREHHSEMYRRVDGSGPADQVYAAIERAIAEVVPVLANHGHANSPLHNDGTHD